MNEIIHQLLVKVSEPVYFSLFLIIGKNIKSKRLLFIFIMLFEYLALKQFIHYNVWFQLIYTFMSFVNLKVLYKEKAQVTDIFLFMVASLILIVTSVFSYFVSYFTIREKWLNQLINRPIIFLILFFGRNKIKVTYNKFCMLWNRHNNKTKIRSLTLRNISIIFFNLMFCVINIGMTIRFLISF